MTAPGKIAQKKQWKKKESVRGKSLLWSMFKLWIAFILDCKSMNREQGKEIREQCCCCCCFFFFIWNKSLAPLTLSGTLECAGTYNGWLVGLLQKQLVEMQPGQLLYSSLLDIDVRSFSSWMLRSSFDSQHFHPTVKQFTSVVATNRYNKDWLLGIYSLRKYMHH